MKKIRATRVFAILIGIIFILLILNIASFLNLHYNELGVRDFFFRKTNFNMEKNLPSFFSSLLHFFAAVLLAKIGWSNLKIKHYRFFWFAMSVIFLFLGLDELLRIHEKIEGFTVLENNSDTVIYNWIIFYLAGLVILGIVFIKPLIKLPGATLINFIIAGVIFVAGAVGLENAAGAYIVNKGIEANKIITNPVIFGLSTVEEFLEMIGVSYFIYGILGFMETYKVSGEKPGRKPEK